MNMKNPVRQAMVDQFLSALKEERIPWRECWSVDPPTSFATGKSYRGENKLMLSFVSSKQGYTDPRWMTYHQAREQGWQVRKGEKGTKISFRAWQDKLTKETLNWEDVKKIRETDPDRIQNIIMFGKEYSVFNGQQIDGIPEWEADRVQADMDRLLCQRDQLLANLGVGLTEGGDRAFYQVKTDTITMPGVRYFESGYGYMCTLLHEAGHATGHPNRLNRPVGNRFGTPDYAKEELRAEIASAFTAQALNIPMDETALGDSLDNHTAYIQSWIKVLEDSPDELFDAIRDADKISDYLQEHGQFQALLQEKAQTMEPEEDIELEP